MFVFSTCNETDTWSWTAEGSLQYKQKMCLKPKTGGANPDNGVIIVLGSACNDSQNMFEFVPSEYRLMVNVKQVHDYAVNYQMIFGYYSAIRIHQIFRNVMIN